jgi:hypothetical protein
MIKGYKMCGYIVGTSDSTYNLGLWFRLGIAILNDNEFKFNNQSGHVKAIRDVIED